MDKDTFADSVCVATRNTEKYLTAHFPVAERLNKPVVLEEFGYPRDGNSEFEGEAGNFWDGVCLSKESSTAARDEYYSYAAYGYTATSNDKTVCICIPATGICSHS